MSTYEKISGQVIDWVVGVAALVLTFAFIYLAISSWSSRNWIGVIVFGSMAMFYINCLFKVTRYILGLEKSRPKPYKRDNLSTG